MHDVESSYEHGLVVKHHFDFVMRRQSIFHR
jgi:hypothetical protein